jgi:pyridinium-3,5-biscarboxylic acid mononucleotide synthase
MNPDRLRRLLEDVKNDIISVEEAQERLRNFPTEMLGFARIDHQRSIRTGMPEVIFGEGKSPEQVASIFKSMVESGVNVLATRLTADKAAAIHAVAPTAAYNPIARTVSLRQQDTVRGKGTVAIVCAGTSDLPVAEEARQTAEAMGSETILLCDVGVAGLHRLLEQRPVLDEARIIVVCAGMEGALPTVVAGLVRAPVIAVPTSVGYGASFGGITALLGMLNSCAPNVSVVNIDNGFGAGHLAALLNRL